MDNQEIGQTPEYQPIHPQPFKPKPWMIVVGVLFIIIIVVIFLFYNLVKENVDEIKSQNQGAQYNIVTTDDPYKGSVDAKIVIVEFSDFQCPFCLQSFPIVKQVISKYGDQIKFIYRDLPNSSIHPEAQIAAEAGECAHAQGKFWEMHDQIFINQNNLTSDALKGYAQGIGLDTNLFNTCLDEGTYTAEVGEDYSDAIRAGVTGTPTFFINDKRIDGVISFEAFEAIIDQLVAIYYK